MRKLLPKNVEEKDVVKNIQVVDNNVVEDVKEEVIEQVDEIKIDVSEKVEEVVDKKWRIKKIKKKTLKNNTFLTN